MIRVGVIGYGYWGPNVVRNLCLTEGFQIVAICDRSLQALGRAKQVCPWAEITTNEQELFRSTQIDVIAVVTPVWSHYELAKAALQNGKHVFVEKPFTASGNHAEELIELAERNKLIMMVDHTFLFTGAVRKIHDLIMMSLLRSASSISSSA